jgi:hypothetical protein
MKKFSLIQIGAKLCARNGIYFQKSNMDLNEIIAMQNYNFCKMGS